MVPDQDVNVQGIKKEKYKKTVWDLRVMEHGEPV